MLIDFKNGQTSVVLRIKLQDSTVTTGAGKTGMSSTSSGLIISTIADNEATATAYTVAGSTIDTITTLGTFAAPTTGHCRFKEVDSTNHKGLYEIQISDARFAVSGAKSLTVSLSGVTGMAECDFLVPLRKVDLYDGVRGGMTAFPNVASGSAGALLVDGTGTAAIANASGQVLVQSGTGTGQLSVAAGIAAVNVTQNAGTAITSAAGRQEVNTTHFGGTAGTFATGIPATNLVQWRGVQPNNLTSGRVEGLVGAMASAVIAAANFATDAIDANALAAAAVTEIAAGMKALNIETNGPITLGQAMSLMVSVLCGVTSGGGNTLKDPSGTSTRITATIDGSNNRTAMSLTPST